MQSFNEYRFRQQVDSALTKIRTILDNTRAPQYPADVQHRYDDKYGLAEFLTNTAIAAQLNCLDALGVNEKHLKQMKEWSQNLSVTLRLKSEEKCSFVKEATRKVDSKTQFVTEYKSSSGATSSVTDKVVTVITEYFWNFEVEYELFAFQGNNPDEKISLQGRKGQFEIITTTKTTPKPQVNVVPSIDVEITWLLQHLSSDKLQSSFSIDRTKDTCRTPRRNKDIEESIEQFKKLFNWSSRVKSYFMDQLFPVQTNHGLNLGSITSNEVFVPVVPLFEEKKKLLAIEGPKSEEGEKEQSLMPVGDVNNFLTEQKRSLAEKFSEIAKQFTDKSKLITAAEAKILVINLHSMQIGQYYYDGIEYIESMLRKQLVAAIGKEVQPVDFYNYMKFHNRKLFKLQYQPTPFCFAVRRPDHYPEGTVNIEGQLSDGSVAEPIFTNVRRVEPASPMSFNINAATKVTFGGERYLHAYVMHQFAGQTGATLNLVARARQFSSFMVLIGRIVSATQFEPKHAMIVQNKDEFIIPLLLEQIPSPKEFRDAIESLSPEQQRFCKAFRAMQLESSLFGICIIQIKPQLEKLLKIPDDSLTKEIQLTQNLLELFIKYQIPSDLLSYDGDADKSTFEKIQTVKTYVQNMYDMINTAKEKELQEAKQEAQYLQPLAPPPTIVYRGAPPPAPAPVAAGPPRKMLMETTALRRASAVTASFASASVAAPPPAALVQMQMQAPAQNYGQMPKPSSVAQPQASKQEVKQEEKIPSTGEGIDDERPDVFDFTKIPTQLDKKFSELDTDNALRPTIINTGKIWTKKSQKALLADPSTESMNKDQQKTERNRAFDLLDALSRSGALSIDSASLHVVLCATHCFDKSLMDTIIQDNVNPIEKVERSGLIISTTIQDKSAAELIKPDQKERIGLYSPKLLTNE